MLPSIVQSVWTKFLQGAGTSFSIERWTMCYDVSKACPCYPDAHHIRQSDDLAIANIYATL